MPSAAYFATPDPSSRERFASSMALVAFAICIISPLAMSYLWLVHWLQPEYFRSLLNWKNTAGTSILDRSLFASFAYPAAAFAVAFSSLVVKSVPRAGRVMLFCVGCLVIGWMNAAWINNLMMCTPVE